MLEGGWTSVRGHRVDQRLFYLAVAYMFISAGCVSTSKQCDSRCQLHTALTDVAKVKIPGGPTASNELADQAFRDLVGPMRGMF